MYGRLPCTEQMDVGYIRLSPDLEGVVWGVKDEAEVDDDDNDNDDDDDDDDNDDDNCDDGTEDISYASSKGVKDDRILGSFKDGELLNGSSRIEIVLESLRAWSLSPPHLGRVQS